jgi:hypothetical protein
MLARLRELLRRDVTHTELDNVLQTLDDDLGTLSPVARAELFERAGTLCMQTGESRARAQAYLGQAIDHFLEAGELAQAAVACRRLLRISADPVRTHFTLACIALAHPDLGSAEGFLNDYIAATRRTRTERFAIPRLRLLGTTAGSGRVARLVADALGELGDDEGRSEILAHVYLAGDDGGWNDSRRVARRLTDAARTDPRDLWARTWISGVVGPQAPRAGPPAS